ncbi:hypothetical protein E2C01_089937 [Portunus trituberculatus]|uniref:Uncharacterized protein n=1 Tax=Portunus trituberculatus TaxID=210409 RepID=A0A5B7JK38_PORTR|nr:hypothetical protein [Portunus trituberculatus]
MNMETRHGTVVQRNHAHGFESCPRSKFRLGFLTRGNGFLAGGL